MIVVPIQTERLYVRRPCNDGALVMMNPAIGCVASGTLKNRTTLGLALRSRL